MSTELIISPAPAEIVSAEINALPMPLMIAQEGDHASRRFVEFFVANIHNANTRSAYARAVVDFLDWCPHIGVERLGEIQPIVVAAWVEELGRRGYAKATIKLKLAGVRMLFDWLVTGQVIAHNPAASVKGPRLVVRKGKTPVLQPEEHRQLVDSIPDATVGGLRDRALISTLVYSFARISAAVAMNVADYAPRGTRRYLILQEKGGVEHEVPAHHKLDEALHAYIEATGLSDDPHGPLFRSLEKCNGGLTEHRLSRVDAYAMIKRRAKKAGIATPISNHSFRVGGITAFLENGGSLETAQQIAAHANPRTTKLYDRTADEITLEEVERIRI